MSATRLLILGVLRQLQPAHGYSIRQRLESWQVDEWANVAYGSIYFALNKMAKEGFVEEVGTAPSENHSTRVTYIVTDRGEEEYLRLLREHWSERKPLVDPFLAALAFMPSLPEDEILQLLHRRIASARKDAEALEAMSRSPEVWPRHVGELLLLTAARARAEIEWSEAAIEKVQHGELP
jgi:DNA-binding PadR family transcriptional regulator